MSDSTLEPVDEALAAMRLALEEAELAFAHGDVPIGAVVLSSDGRVIARDHNRREQRGDPTAHAELLAIREAARDRGHWRLEGATVFVTLEPCAMCAGALVNARVARLVYGAADPKAGAVASLFRIGEDTRLNHRFEVRSGVMADEATEKLRRFFGELRRQGQK